MWLINYAPDSHTEDAGSEGRHDKGEIADRFTWATGSAHLPPVPLIALPLNQGSG